MRAYDYQTKGVEDVQIGKANLIVVPMGLRGIKSVKGEYITTWGSLKEAANSVGYVGSASIIKCCKNLQKSARGYIWKFEKNLQEGCNESINNFT